MTQPETCNALIDLARPWTRERVRGFQPPWYTVFVYRCAACGEKRRVRAVAFRGTTPVASLGAIRCGAIVTHCGCSDTGCPVHPRRSCDLKPWPEDRVRVYRIDMEDGPGTVMCAACAEDALDSGVFCCEVTDADRG